MNFTNLVKKIAHVSYHLIFKRFIYSPIKKIFFLVQAGLPYALVPVEYLLLVIFSPLIKIRVGELESRAIGHFSLPVEIYLAEREIHSLNKKNTDIFYFNKIICNNFLRDKWLSLFNIHSRYWLEPFYITVQKLLPNSPFLVPYRHWRTTETWQQCDLHSALTKTPIHLRFSATEDRIGYACLTRLGLTPDRYVCFHARDPNYREGPLSPIQFRDSSILSQIPAMTRVTELGYRSVRMGRRVRERLDTPHPSIVDYPFTSVTSDFADIYIIARCWFMVCTGSGLEAVALMFRKPLVCVNISQWGLLDLHDQHQYRLFIPKKQVWHSNKRPLTLTEIQAVGSHWFTSQEQYDHAGIKVLENTPEEIADVVSEMAGKIRGDWISSVEGLQAQCVFRERLIPRNGRTIPMQIGEKYILNNRYLLQ